MPYWVHGSEPSGEPSRFFSDAESPTLAWDQALAHGLTPERVEDADDPRAEPPPRNPQRSSDFAGGAALGMLVAPLWIVMLKEVFGNAGLGDWRIVAVPFYLFVPLMLLRGAWTRRRES